MSIGALKVRGFRRLDTGISLLCVCNCGNQDEYSADEASKLQACRRCFDANRANLKRVHRRYTVSAAARSALERARAARKAKREAARAARPPKEQNGE